MFKNLNIRTKILISFIPIVILIGVVGYVSIIQINKISQSLEQNIPESIQSLQTNSYLDNLAKDIRYYDEVLTQSARNYAFTQNKKWEDRYNTSAPELDKEIKEALAKGDAQDQIYFSSIDQSNQALVKMEEDSMNLVDNGQASEAVKILESDEYWNQKTIYSEGLTKYIEKRGSDYSQSLAISSKTLDAKIAESQSIVKNSSRLLIIILIITLLITVLLSLAIAYFITKPIIDLKNVAQKIAEGKFKEKAKVTSQDEIGQLATSFNKMYDTLQNLHLDTEEKISERTKKLGQSEKKLKEKLADVERANQLMIGRELKMIELKEKISGLENKK